MKTCKQLMQEMYAKEVPDKSISYTEWENNVYLTVAKKIIDRKTKISMKKEIVNA
jgi:hypothetical protein